MYIGIKNLKVNKTGQVQKCFVIEAFGYRMKAFVWEIKNPFYWKISEIYNSKSNGE